MFWTNRRLRDEIRTLRDKLASAERSARLNQASYESEARLAISAKARISELEIEREIVMRCITGTGCSVVESMRRLMAEGEHNRKPVRL